MECSRKQLIKVGKAWHGCGKYTKLKHSWVVSTLGCVILSGVERMPAYIRVETVMISVSKPY